MLINHASGLFNQRYLKKEYTCTILIFFFNGYKHIGPSLVHSSFNVTEILKIVMRDAGIIHYPLFLRKNNTCSSALLKLNYRDGGIIYL